MPQMNDDVLLFTVNLDEQQVRTLLYAVNEAIRVWPGYPARPAEEQEELLALKQALFTMTLEMSWNSEA